MKKAFFSTALNLPRGERSTPRDVSSGVSPPSLREARSVRECVGFLSCPEILFQLLSREFFNLHVVESNPEVSGCSCSVEAIKDSLRKQNEIDI